jgi:Fe-S-cluster containining protein
MNLQCLAGGNCCRFDLVGHRLYVSAGELALLTLELPPAGCHVGDVYPAKPLAKQDADMQTNDRTSGSSSLQTTQQNGAQPGAAVPLETTPTGYHVGDVYPAKPLAKQDADMQQSAASPTWPALRCPYQQGALCMARANRPLGCRAFFCRMPAEIEPGGLYERYHQKVKELHDRYGLEYFYVEMTAAAAEYFGREVLPAGNGASSRGNVGFCIDSGPRGN